MERRQEVESNERWNAAMANITGMSNNLQSLQNLLLNKAVYVDDDTFFKASLTSQQARTIKVLLFFFCYNFLVVLVEIEMWVLIIKGWI